MKYITYKRFKTNAFYGETNLPAMTEVENINGVIYHDSLPLCLETSENAHQFFTTNEDGMGMKRGRLLQAIQKTLAKKDNLHQERWDKIWNDPLCQKYKRKDHEDYWLWNHEFFNASIHDLQYIAALINIKL